jgi:hypothetical protein
VISELSLIQRRRKMDELKKKYPYLGHVGVHDIPKEEFKFPPEPHRDPDNCGCSLWDKLSEAEKQKLRHLYPEVFKGK